MLPIKKRKLEDAAATAAEDELDYTDDEELGKGKPAWHAFFILDNRAWVPDGTWVGPAQVVASKVKSRDIKHVMWWDRDALNPPLANIYGLPHLNYTHDTGVLAFSVPLAYCQPLASYLEKAGNYDAQGWLVMAGMQYPGYAKYPYVHSPLGQIPGVQEVRRAPPRTPLAII